ncbi:hypothetical protein GGR51DRAFT_577643 [Nemania sp. FL0031]|nr:hypothetical protein GGR51DRAFT_577643 [Nemania sp. FL0031]
MASSKNCKGISGRKFSRKTKKEKRETLGKRERGKAQRVARAKALIRAVNNNEPLDQFTNEIDIREDLVAMDLYLDDYRDLLREIEEDSGLENDFEELKCEYTKSKRGKQFAIRIPDPVHANLAGAISSAINGWAALVTNGTYRCGTGGCTRRDMRCSHKGTMSIAARIQDIAGKRVKYTKEAESDISVPDSSFELSNIGGLHHAGLVIEVGWTQESEALSRKCRRYIEKSQGLIRTVVGIDLHELYKCYEIVIGRVGKVAAGEEKAIELKRIHEMAEETLKREATGKISVWHSKWNEATGTWKAISAFSNHEFRDKNGKSIGNVALCLSLQAFISERIEGQVPYSHNPRCAISAEYLCSRLNDGLEELFVGVPEDPADSATQIDWNPDQPSKLAQDDGERPEPPYFLPSPPTAQGKSADSKPVEDNPAEDNPAEGTGRPMRVVKGARRILGLRRSDK